MTRLRLYKIARITGHVSWWAFVVAVLLGTTTTASIGWSRERVQCSTGNPTLQVCSSLATRDVPPGVDILATYATVALGFAVVAAITEAITVSQRIPGVFTIAVPIAAATVTIKVLNGTSWWENSFDSARTVTLVAAAIAVREAWAYKFAPGITDLSSGAASTSKD
ncbi:hypothetical protein OHB26_16905 [Nocardia sp. NBC_01503]|uniref:hypothetical protein n=1 Tax=Nocardia sp. NBC_01503 TaxID=2975997 RepID=UPI002E7B5A09|nr:hypothetical protein [Nocardia sp. NBC_01503]WTL35725.1 hypothetical protein OHB26_16905 [Nocardia sp. NBC_01503]